MRKLNISRQGKGQFLKGGKNPWKGLNKKNCLVLKKISITNSLKRGPQTSMWGRKHSKATKEKMRAARLKNPIYLSGEKHHNWRGGTSFAPYALGWNNTFKEQIRFRDKYKCQICGKPEVESYRKLDVHHIDYNKLNLEVDNLITLCQVCHIKTNYRREHWINFFRKR